MQLVTEYTFIRLPTGHLLWEGNSEVNLHTHDVGEVPHSTFISPDKWCGEGNI